jgi:DNA-binding CsgD family transcriptional regulator/tetratricopeptide (TPR) repeat protein
MLTFLLSRLGGQRLLVIGTYRSDDMHRRHPLRPLLAELVRLPAVERLHLEAFNPADAETFVRSLADHPLPDELVHSVAARSEGNPFMAEELLSAFSDRVPHELAEILLARVERLAQPTQQLMRLASVIGRRFTHERLSAAAEPSAEELDDALWEAVAHHVLVTEPPAETYAFRHALLREAVYADLLPGERSRLHARVASALAGDASPGAAAELAHHSMESHDLTTALSASVRAAREAAELGAPAEMLLHAERALQLWRAVSDPEKVSGVDELGLTRWAAWAASASGEPDRAIAHSRSAIELADTYGDDLEAADLRRNYASYLFTLVGTEERAYQMAQEAWRLVADREPSPVKAWVQATLARASAGVDRYDDAGTFASDAMRTAREVPGDGAQTAAQADALVTRAVFVERRLGRVERAMEQLAEAAELARRVDALNVELRARFNSGMTVLEEGRLTEAVALFDAAVDRAASTGLTWSGYGLELRVLQVMGRFMVGDWDGAEAAAELAGEAVSGTVATRVSAAGLLVTVGRGRFDTARRRLTHLRERWQLDTQVMTLVGVCGAELELWCGRPAEAAGWVEQALHWIRQYEPWHLAGVSLCAFGVAAYADLAEVARRAKDQAAERAAVKSGEELAARAADTMVNGRPNAAEVGPEGQAWMRRVQAEAGRLHGDNLPMAWRQVIEAFGYGETYRQAHARWRCAEALLAGGQRADREEAAAHLRAAAQVAEALGATPLGDVVAKLARRARLGLGGEAVPPSDPLTPRERSVLTLVAAGRTNRQIGDELFISEKTVSVHLSRVMTKLGVTSRTEAVSAAYERGLLASTG